MTILITANNAVGGRVWGRTVPAGASTGTCPKCERPDDCHSVTDEADASRLRGLV